MNIILASHNPHKVKEIRDIVDHPDIIMTSLEEIGFYDEIVEDGETLQDNAWIKANTIYKMAGKNVMADDTGLEVFALDKAPGVHSARYAGNHRSSEDNMDKLLEYLKSSNDRSAQFRTVVAMWLDGDKYEFEGIVKGVILPARQGSGGFGYDPIFRPEGYEDSFGVLSPEIKNEISHRGRAFAEAGVFLREYMTSKKG